MRTVQQTCIYNIKHVHNIMHNAIYNRYCIYIYTHLYSVYIYIYWMPLLMGSLLMPIAFWSNPAEAQGALGGTSCRQRDTLSGVSNGTGSPAFSNQNPLTELKGI